MNELKKFYEKAKASAKDHMQKGQINLYLGDLIMMNNYKRQMESA